ncbi:MAG: ribulokinase [Phycisphaerae bacterium]|nr:ribulokinase [Phycisphaerae bacterium]
MKSESLFVGLDFGTESVRAVVCDRSGRTVATAESEYAHGQIVPGTETASKLFRVELPDRSALQHPGDWLRAASVACRAAVCGAGLDPARVVGLGVDFTSCTVLPCTTHGLPLCLSSLDGALSKLAPHPHAWPKLWKHHGAADQARRLTEAAADLGEPWLERYGGSVGLEWFFPKILEVIEADPEVADAAEVWIEAGDWFVWHLVGSPGAGGQIDSASIPRSTCQAGYKAQWSPKTGFPAEDYLGHVHPALGAVRKKKLPGRFVPPGRLAGTLSSAMAEKLGLHPGVAVSAAIIDAHAGVPGAGVAQPGTLVMVLGTSACHMLLSEKGHDIPGIAGVVQDGILPGLYAYETGQAAVGDSFEFVRVLTGQDSFEKLEAAAERIDAGSDGIICMDWFAGCRTPLMDSSVSGGFIGLRLSHTPGHFYRAAMEGAAFGLRWIVETLRTGGGGAWGGVPVERFIATGGIARRSPLFLRIVASALGERVYAHQAPHGPALGAAILGALAAGADRGGFADPVSAVRSMAGETSVLPAPVAVDPVPDWVPVYERMYHVYRRMAQATARPESASRAAGAIGRREAPAR